jgi:uncharacterized repeat protein (TIGR03806 family)
LRVSTYLLSSAAVALAVVASAGIGACTETLPQTLTAPPALASGLDARPQNTTCTAPAVPQGRVRLEPAFTGFKYPLDMVDRPDRGLLYVAEMQGRIKVVDRANGQVSTALDLVGKVGTDGVIDQALFGLAMHPTKPYAFVMVDRLSDTTTLKDKPFRAELLRFTLSADGRTFDPASEKLILRIDRPRDLHYPGTLKLGPDGFLYVGVGDGGRNYAPDVLRYDPTQLLGSVLRLDVDSGEPYGIPADNPFVAGGGRPEIWAGGLRNPWRFSFDRLTGDVWAGDVGENAFEEINKLERGKNYGWPTLEGAICFKPHLGCDPTGLTPPIFTYPHAEGASITGGYVYRGTGMPDLAGDYIFADFSVGRIWALEGEAGSFNAELLNPGGPKPMVSSFGEDADGELYAIGWDTGTLFKLVPGVVEKEPAAPPKLSETGCVNRADPRQLAPGLVPYGVNVELWSDGADKSRYVALPDGAQIHVEDNGHFTLPERSVVLKDFRVDGKLVETRLLFRHEGGDWSGVTYEWNDEQTDAVLLDAAKEKVLPNGQTWSFPSPAQCFVCHTKLGGITLGLEALQQNGPLTYATGRTANQLTTLSLIGYLDKAIDPAGAPRLPELTGTAPVEDRARAYLHANCSMCHREGSGTTRMDFRFGQPRSKLLGCAPTNFAGIDDPNIHILSPGAPERSAIFLRMTTRQTDQMPPLGTHQVDPVGSAVVGDWIRQLTECSD